MESSDNSRAVISAALAEPSCISVIAARGSTLSGMLVYCVELYTVQYLSLCVQLPLDYADNETVQYLPLCVQLQLDYAVNEVLNVFSSWADNSWRHDNKTRILLHGLFGLFPFYGIRVVTLL
jgi:hypothetical protein